MSDDSAWHAAVPFTIMAHGLYEDMVDNRGVSTMRLALSVAGYRSLCYSSNKCDRSHGIPPARSRTHGYAVPHAVSCLCTRLCVQLRTCKLLVRNSCKIRTGDCGGLWPCGSCFF